MGTSTRKRGLAVLVALLATVAAGVPATPAAAQQAPWRPVPPGPAPVVNPLTGFIPYAGSYSTFPYSMEWFYLPVNAVMSGPDRLDWSAVESQLNAIAARGHQAAFRFYLDYPGKPSGVPRFLLDGGLVTHSYDDYGNDGISVSPDYDDPALDTALDTFIAAFGHRYDGDPRIGFIQLGLIGFWGEWHTYPYDGWAKPENWLASAAEQARVVNAYTSAFRRTRLQVRYPGADNAAAPVGYHDDSFAVETLPGPGWHFMDKMTQAGATGKWLTQSIGGELRPEIQGCIFDAPADCPVIEDFADNDFPGGVAQTHVSWLLNQYAFAPGYTGGNYDRALAGAQSMGYRLQATGVRTTVDGRRHELGVDVRMQDLGVAPFYYDWPVQIAAVDKHGRIAKTWTTPWRLTTVTPQAAAQFSTRLPLRDLRPGAYTLVLRAANPMPNGVPLRFANAGQDQTLTGWLTLGGIRL
ncbi:DUF4832 domain-containing protein [Hamadaea tsunoensis]|uniref:DUF4832 domain-containing protein n=1 Tax=Hamadaea tsunoensis TaxID=53368 RepID=UPI0004006433|nr:DUF4832 domain-containing protein [Hamadaea tsunoensis]